MGEIITTVSLNGHLFAKTQRRCIFHRVTETRGLIFDDGEEWGGNYLHTSPLMVNKSVSNDANIYVKEVVATWIGLVTAA
eukprot:1506672-Amphidinium_carterae.1